MCPLLPRVRLLSTACFDREVAAFIADPFFMLPRYPDLLFSDDEIKVQCCNILCSQLPPLADPLSFNLFTQTSDSPAATPIFPHAANVDTLDCSLLRILFPFRPPSRHSFGPVRFGSSGLAFGSVRVFWVGIRVWDWRDVLREAPSGWSGLVHLQVDPAWSGRFGLSIGSGVGGMSFSDLELVC